VVLITPAFGISLVADLARGSLPARTMPRRGAGAFRAPGMLHAKALIVDQRHALLGSANFDFRSLFVNSEIGVFIHTVPEVARIRSWAAELAARCHAYKPRQRKRRLPLEGVLEDPAGYSRRCSERREHWASRTALGGGGRRDQFDKAAGFE
jgi:cardiolipin synthase